MARRQWATAAALRALASTGVPTAMLSSTACAIRSSGDGAMVMSAASKAIMRSRSGSMPACRRYGSSGTRIIFTPISTSDTSPSVDA